MRKDARKGLFFILHLSGGKRHGALRIDGVGVDDDS